MFEQFKAEKINKNHADLVLLSIVLLLIGLGLCALFSITYQFSLRVYNDPLHLFKKQLLFVLAFGLFSYLISHIKLDIIKPAMPLIVLGTIILLILPFIPGIGVHLKGGNRWINMGPLGTLQPSEISKLVVILYIAYILDKKGDKKKDLTQGFIPPVLILSLFVLIIFLQRDISTALYVFILGYVVLFMGKVKLFHLFGFLIPIIGISLVLVIVSPHAQNRVLTYIGVIDDPQGMGYQIEASMHAFSRGGFFGKGLGLNMIEGSSVPEAQSDFIIPAISEEVGFVGIVLLFGIFILFCFKGFQIAWKVKSNQFLFLTAAGITFSITFQAIVNIAVASKLIPTTGIPLPFFSAGGSSLMVSLIMCGILAGISSQIGEVSRNE